MLTSHSLTPLHRRPSVLVVNASLGGASGNTAVLLDLAAEWLARDATVARAELSPNCGYAEVREQLRQADALLFGTGTHWDSWSHLLQKLLEDATPDEGTELWLGKPSGVVVTMHAVGGKGVLSRLQGVLNTFGCIQPPMTGLVYSLANQLAAESGGPGGEDLWSVEDLEVVCHNLLAPFSAKPTYRAWPVDREHVTRRWIKERRPSSGIASTRGRGEEQRRVEQSAPISFAQEREQGTLRASLSDPPGMPDSPCPTATPKRPIAISRWGSWLAAACISVLAPACSQFRPTLVPLRTQAWPARAERRADTLVVLLPGRGDRLGDFERHGFISILREARIVADIITVDAHLGYYYKRTVIERLQADVLAPARARGYRRIVVGGISLGGLGALLTARDQPASVDALVLLSPYLGDDRHLFKAIAAEGGPAKWAAQQRSGQAKVDRELWTFLGLHSADLPPTWIFSGTKDYLQTGQHLLASLLSAGHFVSVPGGHDWATWKKLWREVCLTSEVFATERRPAAAM